MAGTNCLVKAAFTCLGLLLMSVLSAIIAGVVYALFWMILPKLVGDEKNLFYFVVHGLLWFILFNIVFNYVMVVMTDPGVAPEGWKPSKDDSRFCRKCNCEQPSRCYHCSICNKCIAGQDHHCPWILNCVGYRNHRFFILFLIYLWAGCVYTTLVAIPTMLNVDFGEIDAISELIALLTVVFAGIFSIFLFFFTGWAFYLVLIGETQIEFHKSTKPWNYWIPPKTRRNFEYFFMTGRSWWWFWVPTTRVPTWQEWNKWNDYKERLDDSIDDKITNQINIDESHVARL